MSYLMPLFSLLPLQFLRESLQHFFFKKEERRKVQSEAKRSVIFQSISIPYQNHSELLFCKSYLHCNLKMLPVYEAIIANPGLTNQKRVSTDLDLHEACGCCLPVSGRENTVDRTELPARGRWSDPGPAICIPGSRWDSAPWGALGCRRLQMIKSGTRMCAE